MKLHYSYHITIERKERFDYIMGLFNYDIGNPVATVPDRRGYKNTFATLTNNGVVIIWNSDKQEISTMYLARTRQALGIYCKAHQTNRMDDTLYKRIKENQFFVKNEPNNDYWEGKNNG